MKHANLQTRFHEFMSAEFKKPFAWGTNDCITFAKRMIEATTDHRIELDVTWNDEAQAALVLNAGGGLAAMVDRYFKRAPWGHCIIGDIVLADWGRGDGLCVHDGAQLLTPGPEGLRRIPFRYAKHGWRVE